MSWSGWYLRNSSISANLRSVIGVVTPFRWLVVLLLEGNAPVTFSVNHRPDSPGFYTLPGTLTRLAQGTTCAFEPVEAGGTLTPGGRNRGSVRHEGWEIRTTAYPDLGNGASSVRSVSSDREGVV